MALGIWEKALSAKTAVEIRGIGRRRRVLDVDSYVGQRLRERRIMCGLTQQEAAEALGISYQKLHKYEKGVALITAGRLYAFARLLDVRISYFFEDMDPERPGIARDQETLRQQDRALLELARSFAAVRNQDDQHFIAIIAHDLSSRARIVRTRKSLTKLIASWNIDSSALAIMMGFENQYQLRLFLGGNKIFRTYDANLRSKCLLSINNTLLRILGNEIAIRDWLRQAQQEFEGQAPLSLLLEGTMENILLVKRDVDRFAAAVKHRKIKEKESDNINVFDGSIYIGKGNLEQADELSKKVFDFLHYLGYQVDKGEFIGGSWVRKFTASIKSLASSQEVKRNAKIAQDVLYSVASSEADSKIIDSLATLVNAFARVDDVVVDAGPFLFVKTSVDKRASVFVKRLTLEDRGIINENPDLLCNPGEIMLKLKISKKIEVNDILNVPRESYRITSMPPISAK